MVAVTLLRGLKVSVSTLDAFLAANGVDKTYGAPPFTQDHPDKDAISVLLHTKLGPDADPQRMARVVIPQRRGMNRSTVAYFAYTWVMVYAHRQIQLDADLPAGAPATFEALCTEILGKGINLCNYVKDFLLRRQPAGHRTILCLGIPLATPR